LPPTRLPFHFEIGQRLHMLVGLLDDAAVFVRHR
jgi:hypothetical protein